MQALRRHRVGLCGSHRTGKTTLAREVERQLGFPFIETNGSKRAFDKFGLNPKGDYDFGTRLMVQREILKLTTDQWLEAGERFITDRTPIDMLAYTLADVQRTNVSAELVPHFISYAEECFAMTNRLFTELIIVEPGIPIVEADKSAPGNGAYIEHIATLVRGLVTDERTKVAKYFIGRKCLNLQHRVNAVANATDSTSQKVKNELAGRRLH